MLEEKKCINNEELCEGKEELSIEELDKVNGGGAIVQVKGEDIAKLNTTDAASALQGKVAGVVTTSAGQPCATEGARLR